MKKIFSILLACVVSFSAFVGFTQPASAESKHVYFNLESIECPNTSSSGYFRNRLQWKSKVEVPSIPEVNEYRQFWPSNPPEGDCGAGKKKIEVDQKFQFPVDLDMEVRAVNGNGVLGSPFVAPATVGFKDSQIVGVGGAQLIVNYSVSFE
jgi:hypothetical protein